MNETRIDWNFNFKIHNVEENAKVILDSNPMYYEVDSKNWWKWDFNKFCWVIVNENQLIEFIKKGFKAQGLSVGVNRSTILNALKDESQSRKPKEPKPTWLQIGKTIYDISNNDEFVSTPDYFVKLIIDKELGTSEETPFIDKLFTDWLGNKKDYLYELCAYTISPTLFLDSFFFLRGKGGDGKSNFIKILRLMIGDNNFCTIPFETLFDSTEKFQTYKLRNKLLYSGGDSNFSVLKHTKTLKEISGNIDIISAEKKGSNNTVDFVNTATPIAMFNTLPETTDKTTGFYRRCNLIFFNNSFTGERDVINELETNHIYEINNLLTKSLRILREIYQTRKLKSKLTVEETKKIYEYESNPIMRFIKEEMLEDLRGCFTKNKFFYKYSIWANKKGLNNFTFQEVNKRLSVQPLDFSKTYVYQIPNGDIFRDKESIPNINLYKESDIEYKQIRCLRGFKFKDSEGNSFNPGDSTQPSEFTSYPSINEEMILEE